MHENKTKVSEVTKNRTHFLKGNLMETKVAVVTGASSGIGAELCKKLGSEGYSVVLAARREKELNEVAVQCGSSAFVVVTDVTKRSDVNSLKEAAIAKFGRIDVWVNNAGRGIGRKVLELTDADLDDMITINVKSVLYGIQAVVPYFQEQSAGHVINISSFLGRVPFVTPRSAYNAAKSAVNMLTANLRMDLRRSHPGINVSLVMPGMVLTPFAANALHGTPGASSANSARANAQTPQEVANIIFELIKHPKAEIYTNPMSAESAKAYIADVEAFEKKMMTWG
jgi:NADP-dependent 3-hydroxy acid dehydrogenase YdfG